METVFANKYGWLISRYLDVEKNGQEELLLTPMMRDGIFIVYCILDKCI